MVLKKDIKFISKQQATGTGKSVGNQYAISWLLGIDADNDCLIVLGNPALVLTNTKNIVDMMATNRYAKIFPEFQQYHEDADESVVRSRIFSVCRQKDGELTVAHSNKAMNVKIISKDTPVDGIRVRYLFLDDVCRSKDAGNNKQHEIDISNYWNSWWKLRATVRRLSSTMNWWSDACSRILWPTTRTERCTTTSSQLLSRVSEGATHRAHSTGSQG